MGALTNPFPADAVATFGVPQQTYAHFTYMRTMSDQLFAYLSAYSDPAKRYGGGIGIRGAHGAGKTHVLGWLAQQAAELKSTPTTCVYGKADSTSAFDLYKQFFVKQLDREYLVGLLQKSAIAVAEEQVGLAKITEGLAPSIREGHLQALYERREVDRELVTSVLRDRMLSAHFPTSIAKCLLDLQDPQVGPQAYAWLTGDTSDGADYGLPAYPLRQAGAEEAGSAAADDAAVDAIEAVAFLHNIAGVPFIVCVDQLEVFLRAEAARAETVFSVVKKLVEQVARQNGLLFVAGTDDGWKKLPRDVSPRMRVREPIDVGNLTVNEAAALIGAFVGNYTPEPRVIETIHQLSGATPREILRISHRAFERTDGHLNAATNAELIECARDSGTLGDRRLLCLQLADPVLQRYGSVVRDFAIAAAVAADRLVKQNGQPIVALLTTIASDMVAETQSARLIHRMRTGLEKEWPTVQLIVATIGYSSREIADIFGSTVTTVAFNEQTFSGELEAILVRMASVRSTTNVLQTDGNVLKFLDEVNKRLDRIEAVRREEAEQIQTRVEAAARDVAAPEVKERELRTRWELMEAIEHLEETIAAERPIDERAIVRELLISNEAYTKDVVLDRLGAAYLDVLSITVNYRMEGEEPRRLRTDIASEMRRTLRSRSWTRWIGRPAIPSVVASAVGGAGTYAVFSYEWYSRVGNVARDLGYSFDKAAEIVGPMPFTDVMLAGLAGIVAGVMALLVLSFINPGRRWEQRVARFRRFAAASRDGIPAR